jgi:hypothetical protein
LRSLIRATCFARASALQPNPRELHFSSLPLALIHPRNTPLRAATAALNCTSYLRPPAERLAVGLGNCVREGIHPLRIKIGAVPHRLRSIIRATCLARASAPFNPIKRELHFSSLPIASLEA